MTSTAESENRPLVNWEGDIKARWRRGHPTVWRLHHTLLLRQNPSGCSKWVDGTQMPIKLDGDLHAQVEKHAWKTKKSRWAMSAQRLMVRLKSATVERLRQHCQQFVVDQIVLVSVKIAENVVHD